MPFALSVLDLSPIPSRSKDSEALWNTLDLAQLADELGYHRYWLAEHHSMIDLGSTAPEIMIGQVARLTKRIRIGSGGILLLNHAPLRIAETFRVLEALFPARIDLGLGRASGADEAVEQALGRTKETAEEFLGEIQQLIALAEANFPPEHPFAKVRVIPQDVPLPPLWILGSSDKGAQIAAKLGVGFAYANHFKSDMLFDALDLYRENFQPSRWLQSPRTIVGASVVCADTDAEANVEIPSLDLAWLLRKTDRRSKIPSPEAGLRYPYSSQEREWIEEARRLHIVGNPITVKAGIENLAARTQADEIIISTMIHDHRKRRRSYELIARAFALEECGKDFRKKNTSAPSLRLV
jgi:luciferase family oxidoreductase group 1